MSREAIPSSLSSGAGGGEADERPKLYSPGLDAKQVQEIIKYYDSLTEEEWIAELEAA